MKLLFLISFLVSFMINFAVIKLSRKIDILITDHLHIGPQTFHKSPTPRIGGLGIFLGFLISSIYFGISQDYKEKILFLIVGILFAFVSGFLEDITKALAPKKRFLIITIGAIIVIISLKAYVNNIGVFIVDDILKFKIFDIILATIWIVGLTNGINIIDGFNGLASGVSIMFLLSIAYVAYINQDNFIFTLSICYIGALIGFFVLNFPKGLIFMGDGGAYSTGFFIATIVAMLIHNNNNISSWFGPTLCAYPVVETIYSMYRRKAIKGLSPFSPDGMHLHTLFYKIFTKKFLNLKDPIQRNPTTSVILWIFNLFPVILSTVFYDNTKALMIIFFFFCILYIFVYNKILNNKLKAISKS